MIKDINDNRYDLGLDGAFTEYSILFIILYLCRGIKDENGKVIDEYITEDVLINGKDINGKRYSPVMKLGKNKNSGGLIGKGFDIHYAFDYKSAIKELMSGKYRMTFITCSPGDGIMAKKCDNNNDQYADAFVSCVHEFNRRGGGVFWFLENYPFTYEADLYFKTFYGFEAVGDKNKTIQGGKKMIRVKNETPRAGQFITIGGKIMDYYNLSRLDFGIVSIFEGRTLCTLNEKSFVDNGFRIFARESEGNASIMVREKQEGMLGGRMIIDTAASKLFWEFTEEGTARWISNAAVWLCNTEEFEECLLFDFNVTSGIKMEGFSLPRLKPMSKRDSDYGKISRKQVRFCLSIVMDTTGSMSPYIKATKENIIKILQEIKKVEKDRYLFIFRNENLVSFTEKRFPILDTIRKLPMPETSVSPTVSIGIGAQNCNFSQNEELARQALDMALSRGGDQVVVKTENDFEFFGGRTKGMEKRTKVKSRIAATALRDLLKDVDNVLIMGHKYSDFDSLGASVGLSRIAVAAGKKTGIIFDEKTSLAMPLYERLMKNQSIAERFVDAEKALIMAGPKCLVIVVDTHRAGYSIMPSVLEYAGKIMVVDHHRKSADYIENADFFYHEPYASSASEMVAEIMQYMNISRMPQIEAEAVLSGIYLDTKSFTLRTNPHTFEASSFLRRAGADTVNVKQLFQIDMQTYMCRAEMIKNASVYKKIIAVSVWNGDSFPYVRMAAAQAADELLNIENVLASFTLFRDKDGVVNISGRSFGAINVQLILEKLKGGGHQTMAGAQLSGVTVDKAKDQLISAINAYLSENPYDSEIAVNSVQG